MKQLERGFSLIELLVTISVIAILSAIAVPSFQSMIETRRLIAATEGVYAHLQFARSEAVKFGFAANLNVSIKTGTPWCLGISNATASCDCNTAGACVYGPDAVMQRNLIGSEFTNVALSTNQANAQLDGIRGGFGGTAGTITLTSSPSNRTTNIVFSRLGRVKICSASGVGGYPSC
ncbi:GspH/FimT family pseudopilin [Rhodoferax sp.]|uniref:GspH/FimT family pseudopilin n=1 Tax=Rhodoferax sp. TaxID=50421 RepID=UPI0025F34B6E|nr:GspH/FimT family pseudopilin [Rhodoferax sp.]MCM2296658.1 GspH/FimT family pseudopilin [Rhodoferax sp.]